MENESQINPDGTAFNGNWKAVGIAAGLVVLGALVLVGKLVIAPLFSLIVG